jgi:hypothetical protein
MSLTPLAESMNHAERAISGSGSVDELKQNLFQGLFAL